MSTQNDSNTTVGHTKIVGGRVVRRVIIAGGGTGGHIFPAIAIANALKAIDSTIEILFVGAKGKMEMEKVPQAGYQIEGLTIAGFNRSSLIKNVTLPFKLMASLLQASKIVGSFKPDAVIGVGGYASFPVLKYAQSLKIPTYLHESNSFAGKSNIQLGKAATKIFVASEGMEHFFPKKRIMITGNPVRSAIAHSTVSKQEALQFFGLAEGKQTVLIVGGSLGAKSINDAIAGSLAVLEAEGLQLIWQTGKTGAAHYKTVAHGKDFIWVNEFITRMEMAYAAADIVVSRSGAMAVTELCVVGKPVIFVPYPFAAEDHQTANAMALAKKEAGLLVKDNEVNERLAATVVMLSKDKALQQQLETNSRLLRVTNADEVIAREILRA